MASEQPGTKRELMRRQHKARNAWDALIARVPLELLAERGVKGNLSVKDIVAHMAAWERHAAQRLHAIRRGEEPEELPPAGMTWQEYEHAFNARVYETWRNRTWKEVRAEAEDAYKEFLAAAQAVPEEMLFRRDRPAWKVVAFNGYLHYLDFTDAIHRWVAKERE